MTGVSTDVPAPNTSDAAKLDPRELRRAFGAFMTGVTVVTTVDAAGAPLGFTANSFSSVSIDPPLLLVSIDNRSANLAAFTQAKGFSVNILAEDQKDISATFARPSENRFAGLYWRSGPVGAPLLAGVSAWFDCTLSRAIPAGDHTILLGEVGAFEASGTPGLGYYQGAYITPAATAAQIPAGPDVVISAIIEDGSRVLLVDDGRGGLCVPMARVGREGVQAALAAILASVGVAAGAGAIYAVYDDIRRGTQHIALRCAAPRGQTQPPIMGRFVDLTPADMTDISDPALRDMLQRLASETRMGNYGVYFGTHEAGHVQRASKGLIE